MYYLRVINVTQGSWEVAAGPHGDRGASYGSLCLLTSHTLLTCLSLCKHTEAYSLQNVLFSRTAQVGVPLWVYRQACVMAKEFLKVMFMARRFIYFIYHYGKSDRRMF